MTAFMKETTKIQGQESDAEETMLKEFYFGEWSSEEETVVDMLDK